MLHYFAHPAGRCYLPATEAVVPRIKALLEAWRQEGNMIVYTQHCHQGRHDLGMLGRFFSDYIEAGTQEAELIEELAPRECEEIIQKKTYDAFYGTRLEEVLHNQGIEQVLVTGVLTHMCCETTARSAFCRGFEVYVAADGTASSSEERHVCSLVSMADSVAVIMSVAEILDQCRQSTP
jgi:isochorismate hydrolase